MSRDSRDDGDSSEGSMAERRNEQLMACIKSDKNTIEKVEEIKRYLEQGADVDATDEAGDTPLHLAVRAGERDIIKLLLDNNANVNARHKSQGTPLHEAIRRREKNIVKLLLSQNADVNASDEKGDTPLHLAVRGGKVNVIKILLDLADAKHKFHGYPLHEALWRKDKNIVKLLPGKYADVNMTNSDGRTPLHEAVWSGNMSAVELLLDNEADIDAKNSDGDTPLHESARLLDADMAALLVRRGADVTLKNNTGATPLSFALLLYPEAVDEDIVRILRIADVEVQELRAHDVVQSNCPDTMSNDNLLKRDKTRNTQSGLIMSRDSRGDGDSSEGSMAERRNEQLMACINNDKNTIEKVEEVKRYLEQGADVDATDEAGDTPLHLAVRAGEDVIIELLLNKNANINARNKFERTPLHLAVVLGNTNILTLLLSKNADVNPMDKGEHTPLHVAVRYGREVIAKLLLNENANVNAKGKSGITPLHIAVVFNNTNIVTLLLSKNADVNSMDKEGQTALHDAMLYKRKVIAKLLLNENTNVNARGKFGRTSLHIAVELTIKKIVQFLLRKKANVNTTDEEGQTPLHVAVRYGREAIVKLLLNENANINARCKSGITPLHIAVEFENTNIVSLLLSKKADVNTTDEEGRTALYKAVSRRLNVITKLLLNENANVNARYKSGTTLLHLATEYGKKSMVRLLLSKNANVNAKDEEGDTSLHKAARCVEMGLVGPLPRKGYLSTGDTARRNTMLVAKTTMIALLLSKNADVNARNKNEVTPLHEAVCSGNISAVELLLDNEANINAKNSNGDTPLHEAVRELDADIADLLVRRGADVTLENNTGDTPLSFALLYSLKGDEDIVRILRIADEEAQELHDVVQSNCPDTLSNDNLHKKQNTKSNDDFGLSGQLYETKMATLFYLRMLNCELLEHDMYLGVNVNDIGDMDDICLRYRERGRRRPLVLFVQGKHKNCSKSKLINRDLWSEFDLRKYFKSYLLVKQRFQVDNTDPMFRGEFDDIDCHFILYTPARESLGTKKKKTENKMSKILYDLINTSENTEPFQYNYDDADIDRLMKAAAEKDVNPAEYCTRNAKNFFNKLWFYSNQANEEEVERIVKKKINKYYNHNGDANNVMLEQHSEAIFLIVHGIVQDWWKSKNKAPYLTRSKDLFKLAKVICLADVLLIFCNAMNYLRIDVQLQFIDCLHFTTATLVDLNTILCKLLTAINLLRFNKDMDFKIEIVDLPLTDERLERENTLLSSDASDIVHNFLTSQDLNFNNDLQTNNEFQYTKRCATSEVGGALFKMKMSSVIFRRALNHAQIDRNTVLLRAKIQGISMTDICLRFLVKGQPRPLVLFMQFIYRENPEKGKLTVEELWRDSGNFSLLKYFLSYLEIKERFRPKNKDPVFMGEYHNVDCSFFLCTSAEESFTQKKTDQQVRREILDLIYTGENTTVFKFDYDETDIDRLVNVTAKHQIDKLGNIFLKSVFPEKYSPNLLANKLIAKYHVVMGQEVLQPCGDQPAIDQYRMWEFRSEFFDSNLDYLVTLKESLFKTISSKCRDQGKQKLQSLKIQLPLAFGNIDMTFRGDEEQTRGRIKEVADKLMSLLELNKDSKFVEINDNDVGPGKMLQQGIIDINGGIGSAVGNLLIFDTDTKTLKFDMKRKHLPHKASLFLNYLNDNKHKFCNNDLSVYRIKINVNDFPKSSFNDDENDKRQARDFFNKFWMNSNQAKEDKIEKKFQDEINKVVSERKKYYKNGNISKLISKFSLDIMQKWLQLNESPYLTWASQLFERAELAYSYTLLQSVVHFMYISGTHSIDIRVTQSTDDAHVYEQYKRMEQLFKNISSKLRNISDPQFDGEPIQLRSAILLNNWEATTRLFLKVHPRMESVQVILTVATGNIIRYRAFAKACFVHTGVGVGAGAGADPDAGAGVGVDAGAGAGAGVDAGAGAGAGVDAGAGAGAGVDAGAGAGAGARRRLEHKFILCEQDISFR